MAETKRTILLEYDVKTGKLIDENGKVIQSIDQLSSAYGKAKNSQKSFNKSSEETKRRLKELDKLQQNQARSAGLAGAATFEFGRFVSDLPFGIVAVTNNLSQMGTLFAALAANAGGAINAFKLFIGQLMGPAGILIAFQAVTAIITLFAQKSDKAKKAASEISATLREEAAAIEMVTEELAKGNLTLEERLDILERYGIINKQVKEQLEEIGLTEEEQNKVLEKRNELVEKRAALEAARKMSQEGDDPEEIRLKALEEIDELETKLEKERLTRIEVINTARRSGNITEKGLRRGIAKINNDIDSRLLENADAIAAARAKITAAEEGEINLKTAIFDLEKEINELISDRIALEEQRKEAFDSLLEARIKEQQDLTDEAVLEGDLEKFKEHYNKLFALKREQLKKEKEEELKGVEDEQTIKAIESRYRILYTTLNKEFEGSFKKGLEEIYDAQKIELVIKSKGRIDFLKLIETPKTDAQKWAEKEVKKVTDAVTEEFQKRVKQTPALNGEGEGAFDFAKAFGMSKERLDATINLAKTALSSIGDILSAEAEREIAIETNKTNAINDQLRARLANEQLSADERDKINQQIARNEAELVKKENEVNKKRFEQEKAMNISMAVIDTFSAATGVLADTKGGSFLRIAGMIAVITAGLANIAAISKQKFTAKAMPNPRLSGLGTSGDGAGGPAFNVVGTSQRNQLAEAVEMAMSKQPLKAYVVSSDVTTAQQLERNIVEGASI